MPELQDAVVPSLNTLDPMGVFKRLIPDPSDRKAFCLILILKEDLDEDFADHFEEVDGYVMTPKHLHLLATYVSAIYRRVEKDFLGHYGALAKEVCLTAFLADPAINSIPGYTRYVSWLFTS